MKIHPTHLFLRTEDGSPTVEMQNEAGIAEKMHNPRGALEESLYIYADLLKECFSLSPASVRVLSVGLGLGYNEVLSVCCWMKSGTPDFELVSYEKDPVLTSSFVDFIFRRPTSDDFLCAHQWILQACGERFDLAPENIRGALRDLYAQEKWKTHATFHPQGMKTRELFNVILYDAFSAKMNSELWDERNLTYMLQHHVQIPCFFGTYAATGALNRALRHSGFELLRRPGFGGKRESTWARKLS